jgi:predicted ATPase/DNA-binding CsgD family transcriptional regulator
MSRMSGSGVVPLRGISARETEIFSAIGEHLSNAEISAKLFISVRTVESHVSSLLRKLGATDRRELAHLAARMERADTASTAAPVPSPLTSFVGRTRERAALAEALRSHREVTAVGPGGVGKTRLALAVIAAADEFPDGVWYVDLVPVSDPDRVGAAVAAALGIGEGHEGSTEKSIVAALASGRTLLTLDNCEHVLDGVAPLVERLLRDCPQLTVLATSRARLMAPFEWVFPVPPLSLPGDDGTSDAVALFMERAEAAGWPLSAADGAQVADVCRALDGVALAIELAVARLPVLGLDGLQASLSDQLRLLAGSRRVDDRHRSVRATLDWSHDLLNESEQILLRRITVFAAPFTVDAAVAVAGFPPIDAAEVQDGLAHLAEQSLLSATATSLGTRYRALETIRQYGLERLGATGDLDATRTRHLRWCRTAAAALEGDDQVDRATWRARFDDLADDIRAARGWASEQPDHRADAYELTMALARLTFARGLVRECQQRYEQAAGLATNPADVADAYRWAAAAALCRFAGTEAFQLRRTAARTALEAGDNAVAALNLADAAAVILRAPGIMSPALPPEEADELIEAARGLTVTSPVAEASILMAEASRASAHENEPPHVALAESAVELARKAGQPLIESGALDALSGAYGGLGMLAEAARAAGRRLDVLGTLPLDAAVGYELIDALDMACEYNMGAGDLPTARISAQRLHELPIAVEEGHLATAQLIVSDAVAGNIDDARRLAERFREGWERAGRPRSAYLGRPTAAVAMAHGLAGDDDSRADWLAMLDALDVSTQRLAGYGATFDAILLLHRGQAAAALDRLAAEPEDLRRWISGLWRQWYAALKAETAVLTGEPDADERLKSARATAAGNPIATAIVDRAAALRGDDPRRLRAAAATFAGAGCPYQQARTLVLIGGDERAEGVALFTALGIAPPGNISGSAPR